MKKIFGFLISLICVLSFASNVYAASNSISVYNNNKTYEYVNGLEVNYYYSSSYPVYVLNKNTYYSNYTTLTNPKVVSSGFDYIVNNSNPTSSSEKNYYITQVAALWYEDYLNGNNDNISTTLKNYITSNTNDTVCYYINKLVNNAKNYGNDNYIKFNNKNVTFTRNGNYYYSNIINITTNNLSNTPTIGVYNAPTSTEIINKNVYANGNGSFQIRIPVNYLNNYNKDDFEVYVKGYTSNKVTYVYSNTSGVEEAIFAGNNNSSSSLVEESIPVVLDNMIANGSVRLEILDNNGNNIRNIKYYLYEGNCKNTTCSNSDYITEFTTSSNYTNLDGISAGTYTLVRKTNTNYNLNEKELIEVRNSEYTQTITITEEGYNNSNVNKNILIKNSINDYSNVIKVYSSNGNLVDSYRSNETNYYINLYSGNYYITNSDNTVKVYFEIDEYGKIYITENNKREEVSYINLDNYLLRYPSNVENENNNNNNNDYYVDEDGTIHIDNLDNIDSIDISQEVTTETEVSWISNIIDCPITSVSSTIKYIIGAIILIAGTILTVKNVKKSKNNI